jgi:hypothetical protein
VLISYELVLAILFRWCARSCVRDIVWLWRSHVSTGRIITPLPHDIAQMLTAPHLNNNLSICRRHCCFYRRVNHPFFALHFLSWKCCLFLSITLVFVVSILGTKGTTPHLLRLFSRHNNSGSCGVIRLIFFGRWMAR